MLRNRGDDERDRDRFEQLALGDRRTLAGSHLLFDQSALIQLLQHAVEATHQPAEFIARIPMGAQLIIAGGPYAVGHIGEPAYRQRDLARDKIHDAQDQQEQAGRRAEMHPHAFEQLVEPRVEQAMQRRLRRPPGTVEIGEQGRGHGVDIGRYVCCVRCVVGLFAEHGLVSAGAKAVDCRQQRRACG